MLYKKMGLTRSIYIVLAVVLVTIASTSCKKKELLTTGGQLTFSADTVTFDTVFTSLGSFTTWIKIYNRENQKINISSVRLENGNNSYFRLNVNGVQGNEVTNIEVAPKDSIYVFATVKIDPTNINTPFIIEDKLIATLNNKAYSVPFIAYGQNANYIVDSVMQTQTWDDDKPYVIIHNALVDEGQTLTIAKGTRVYVHADSRLYVDGTLKAIGTKSDSIVFQGDRLDRKYFGNKGYPGEWGGLYFTGNSSGNELRHVILRNCGNSTRIGNGVASPAAIQVNYDSASSSDYTLKMYHTIIENSIGNGILSFTGKIYAENCLINTTGGQAVIAHRGGAYNFINCTFANYGTTDINHIDNPTAAFLNYFEVSENNFEVGPLTCSLTNCVVYGSLETELFMDSVNHPDAPYDMTLTNCLVKIKDGIPTFVKQNNCIVNPENTKLFANTGIFDFRPASGSPLIDKGINILTDDLDANPRGGTHDIGCYEFK